MEAKDSFDITGFSSYRDVEGQYTREFIRGSRCVKVEETADGVVVAVSEISRKSTDVLKKVHSGKRIDAIVVKDSDFALFIGKFVEGAARVPSAPDGNQNAFRLEDINSDAPVVNIINAICLEAIRKNASDIHIQGEKHTVDVRFRMDGVLHTVRKLDRSIFDTLVSRIKVMAGLNVMENRLCQDGRMSVLVEGKKMDFRVSIVPAVNGQNIVLRLFNSDMEELSLDQLGFSDANLRMIRKSLKLPYGMILATGPTGSGKTTTLHAMLREMDREHLKIVTIEDPVEKIIEGVEQIQVNDEIGLSFSSILRRILRQDPDVIMVGEIRDSETAELAIRSALTGHLILSTLHTNDSLSTVTRLRNLGIEPYLIAGVLKTSIAQRLIRKTCTDCYGKGCEGCSFTGFRGRSVVSEVLAVDDTLCGMIGEGENPSEMQKYILRRGFVTLKQDAAAKVSDGISCNEELMREGLA